MNKQEIFDKAVGGVLAQGAFSVADHGGCLYRGPDGLKCGVGHLIPDERYNPEFEHITADTVEVMKAAGLRRGQERLAITIQQTHDHESDKMSPSMEQFAVECRRVAKNFGIKPTVIDAWEAKGSR